MHEKARPDTRGAPGAGRRPGKEAGERCGFQKGSTVDPFLIPTDCPWPKPNRSSGRSSTPAPPAVDVRTAAGHHCDAVMVEMDTIPTRPTCFRNTPDPRTMLELERNGDMAVLRKPADETKQAAGDKALQGSIHAGGSTARAGHPHRRAGDPPVGFRSPAASAGTSTACALNRRLKTSRSRWILEAVIEKIERDAPDGHP